MYGLPDGDQINYEKKHSGTLKVSEALRLTELLFIATPSSHNLFNLVSAAEPEQSPTH